MRRIGVLGLVLGLGGCMPVGLPPVDPVAAPVAVAIPGGGAQGPDLSPEQAARNFVDVIVRVEPVAEAICRARAVGQNCDFQIVVDDRPGSPPNAFQTVDAQGRPVVGFTVALIAGAYNADELAFVLGHEAAHHIAGHLPRKAQKAQAGALLGAVLASVTGADAQATIQLQDIAATVSAQSYSKDFELEADVLGTEIAWRAGYDPVLGAAFFDRLPDPGDQFLGSHPPNARRRAVVAQALAALQAQ
ncbi:MAG: M48 family metallopeptidase [Paracoccaceae bacterium]